MPTEDELAIQFGPFTHMVPDEIKLWVKWLAGEGAARGPYNYDVQVGNPIALPDDATPLELIIAGKLTRKRIDALHLERNRVTIYEVKLHAGLTAIGQVKGYGYLWWKDHPDNPVAELIIITNRAQPDAIEYARSQGVTIKELP